MSLKLLIFIFLQFYILKINTKVTSYGNLGDPPLFIIDIVTNSIDNQCFQFHAKGRITNIFIQMYYEQEEEILSYASDLLFTILLYNQTTNQIFNCILQGGYNKFEMIDKHCYYLNHWNNSWNKDYNVLVQDNIYSTMLDGEYWKICVDNGWKGAMTEVRYQALLVFFGLSYQGLLNNSFSNIISSNQPTSFPTIQSIYPPSSHSFANNSLLIQNNNSILSICNEKVNLKYEITLNSNQKSCQRIYGLGLLTSLQFMLNYTFHHQRTIPSSSSSPSPSSTPTTTPTLTDTEKIDYYQGISDLAVTIINKNKQKGIQIGGIKLLDELIYGDILNWPINLYNLNLQYNTKNQVIITIPIENNNSNYNISDNSLGDYEVCIHNTYSSNISSSIVTYYVNMWMNNIQYICNSQDYIKTSSPTLTPTIFPTQNLISTSFITSKYVDDSLNIFIDVLFKYQLFHCIDLIIGGSLNEITLQISYSGNNINWVSDMILSIEDSNSQDNSTCYQIEGVTSAYQLKNCQKLQIWPQELNRITSGFYEATLEFKSPIIFISYSPRKVFISF